MHHKLAHWLTEHPWRAAVMAACFSVLSLQGMVLFVVLASATPVLVSLVHGSTLGSRAGLIASMAVAMLLIWLKQDALFALGYGVVVFALPLLLAALLRRTGSLNLVFQLSVVIAMMVIGVVYAVLPQPAALWERIMNSALQTLAQSGFEFDTALTPQLARTMWGAFVSMLLLALLSALFLARWWQSLLQDPGGFGREFRELRTGVTLGVVLVVIAMTAVFVHAEWLDNMAWVAVAGLALQGLASTHRSKAEGRLRRGWLVAIYVMLIVPLFSFITVALLAGLGCADFWRRMRIGAVRA